jgi:hypothetical protein
MVSVLGEYAQQRNCRQLGETQFPTAHTAVQYFQLFLYIMQMVATALMWKMFAMTQLP